MKSKVLYTAGLLCLLALTLTHAATQTQARPKRDHLTPQEADLVREAQALDKRTAVFIKAAERRVLAITDPNAAAQLQKDAEKWGELKGTRADFLYDLAKILDEAITNIDDVSSRDERNPLVPKAMRKLAEASTRILTQLAPLRDKVEEGKERASFEQAAEYAESVIEAANKLPAAEPEKGGKKKKEGDKQ
jgi:hypothetical protein